uniref:NADH-ubiquinone oxidoreductase chain 4L n=5 Tax=Hypsiglena TaxID=46304 RepID=C5H4S1_HYPCH|nr:NADH dehydrogenase subunit 4L [Hypsiglena chlorophaea chlorophaea]YP_003540742.1 NADH dehydrogenase subunit 4L [Hypsiglena ochrorhyncha ochrorhyncha]YP_003540768.1 NADH dehydrogenase subunit 4L [Hypsiglena sp. DGM-2008]YP_003540892.1 NADH dehydrogenase subunit 4L [Hypsiglena chlorophaea deserticola]ACD77402.1 NADH dehydrogenase subunit 4L [Hypsiglena sp. 2 DGM-2013]QKY63947.1 NADH dehydrogenase subunit 4L [Hypsiglena sp. 1 DGM-2008]ACD77298.1 NADH dehydrogenase subunit 4L [Hypsiglena chlor
MELTKTALYTAFMITIMSLSMQHKHLMLALMCVESMMLILFTMLVLFTSTSLTLSQIPMPTILLTISVCGAAIGLSLVVATTRTHGSDFLKNLSLL